MRAQTRVVSALLASVLAVGCGASSGSSSVTGVDGGYTFGDLPAGRYDVLAFRVDFVAQVPGNDAVGKCRCALGCLAAGGHYHICWPICCAACYTPGTDAYQACFEWDQNY